MVAVEKRLKPAIIVQGMLFCGAAPLSSEITVAVEKRLKPAVIVQGTATVISVVQHHRITYLVQ